MLLLSFLLSVVFSANAAGPGVFLPPELVELIKADFKLEKTQGLGFEKRPITVVIKADNREYSEILGAQKTSIDFADFGTRTKRLNLRIIPPPDPLPPPVEKKTVGHEEPNEGAHGDSKGEDAAAQTADDKGGHGEPAADEGHGAPAGGHGEAAPSSGKAQRILYFVNRYREVTRGGRTYGLPCGKALKIESHLDDLFGPQGINGVIAGGRHIDLFGGDFVLASLEGENLYVSFFKLKDSRHANRLCKMSFE